jgi:hypothetical protein
VQLRAKELAGGFGSWTNPKYLLQVSDEELDNEDEECWVLNLRMLAIKLSLATLDVEGLDGEVGRDPCIEVTGVSSAITRSTGQHRCRAPDLF